MANPLEENRCIRCGADLVDLTSLWHMCSVCTKKTQEDIRKGKKGKNSPRRTAIWVPMLGKKGRTAKSIQSR